MRFAMTRILYFAIQIFQTLGIDDVVATPINDC